MSTADRVVIEDRARPIIQLYVERSLEEAQPQTVRSVMPLIQEILSRGYSGAVSAASATSGLSPRQEWLVDVAWAFSAVDRRCGDLAHWVLLARLTRTPGTRAHGFAAIAIDVPAAYARYTRQAAPVMMEADAGRLYDEALTSFVELLAQRDITRELPGAKRQAAPQRTWTDPESQRRLIAMGRRLKRVRFRRGAAAASAVVERRAN